MTADQPEHLSYHLADRVATITMDDGKANAMNPRMLAAINAALDRSQADAAGAVVLAGRPGMFSGGFDLSVFKTSPADTLLMLEAGARLSDRLLRFPLPLVAACTGHAIAMGLFTLMCCDMRVGVTEGARFQANEVLIGLTLPGFAAEVCRQRLLPSHYQLATLTARPYNPAQALAVGMLDLGVPADQVLATAQQTAAQMLSLNAAAFAASKLVVRQASLTALGMAIATDVSGWQARFGQLA